MFSLRTAWDRRPGVLAERLAEARASGRELLDLTETNPTRAGLAGDDEALRTLADARARHYEPSPRGSLAARDAVAADYARRGAKVSAEHVVLTASTSEAYAFLFKLLCDPADAILVPRPSYPLFEYLARLESIAVRHYPLGYDGEWHLMPAEVRQAADARTRALVVVSPNNPTGSFVKAGEAEALRESCADERWALVSDEVFADYPLRPDTRRLETLAGSDAVLTFALGGLSKSCGLPQLKLAWIAVSGPAAAREEALERLELVADTYLSVSTPVQIALPGILARARELRRPIQGRVQANLEVLRETVRGSPATLLDLEGGWSAVLRLPATWTDEDWALGLLKHEGLLVHPGYFFDFEEDAHVVLSLLTPPEAFAEGLRRLRRRVEQGLAI